MRRGVIAIISAALVLGMTTVASASARNWVSGTAKGVVEAVSPAPSDTPTGSLRATVAESALPTPGASEAVAEQNATDVTMPDAVEQPSVSDLQEEKIDEVQADEQVGDQGDQNDENESAQQAAQVQDANQVDNGDQQTPANDTAQVTNGNSGQDENGSLTQVNSPDQDTQAGQDTSVTVMSGSYGDGQDQADCQDSGEAGLPSASGGQGND